MRRDVFQKGLKLPHRVIVKAPGLLQMQYKVRELAEELGVPESTLRDWLKRGVPYQRDSRNHIWIVGIEFARWVESNRKMKRKAKLKDDEAYCFRCKKRLKLINPIKKPIKGKLIHIKGTCSRCGCVSTRGARIGK